MSETSSTPTTEVTTSLAKERLLWATRPVGLLVLVLWILHPTSAQGGDPIHLALVGFLAGLFYGVVVYARSLQIYIFNNDKNNRFTPNRVPEEYYWGNIAKTMYDNR